jgi:hypothetical protein
MKPSIVTTAVALFTLYAAMSCFCEPAAAIETGSASCAGQKVTQSNDTYSCHVPLGTCSPGGKCNPNDWGMCGVLSLSGFFNKGTAARVAVGAGGFYTIDFQYTSANDSPAKHWPELDWTCVHLNEFKGVPALSDATFFAPPAYSGPQKDISNSKGYACIWAGVAGALTDTDLSVALSAGGSAIAQFRSPVTVIGADNDKSFAFCTGYKLASWPGWKYSINNSKGFHLAPAAIPLNKSTSWCYMDGVITSWDLQTGSPAPIHPAIKISSSGDYSLAGVWDKLDNYVGLSVNCLPLAQ